MRTDRIYLTGYRGTGKTTVGKLISKELSTGCVDLDEVIESTAGKSIREIFAEGGEALFRDWETRCLRHAVEASPSRVISLGGGAILREENREIIRQTGVCIWLTADAETIHQRISGDATTGQRRPALTDLTPVQEIRSLLSQRESAYREVADLTLATDSETPESLSRQAVDWLLAGGHASSKRDN